MYVKATVSCLALVMSLVAVSAAAAEDWHVVQSSGDVWIGSGAAQPVALSSTTDVAAGATLTTGDTGRVMLMRGEQTMLVGPDTVAVIPTGDDQKFVTVLQRTGRIEFDVDRQKDPHFAVETPFLAAVVKGTHFVVSVGASGANVSVDRGLVQVTDLATGEVADTPAGQRASVSGPTSHMLIDGSGVLAAITAGAPRSPLVQRLSADELRALQAQDAGGIAPANTHQNQASQAAGNGLALVAGSAGGDGGGAAPGGGSGAAGGGTGGVSISGGPTVAFNGDPNALSQAAQEVSALNGDGDQLFHISRRNNNQASTTLIIAGALALSVMVAFGFAFLRGRIS